MNEKKDDDENDEKKEVEGKEKNKTQAEKIEFNESEENRTQKISESIVDERRVFTIFKFSILRRSSIEGVSRTNNR